MVEEVNPSVWTNHIHIGDCRDLLGRMATDGVRVQTCVTSPPYYGLRDYGVDTQIGLESTPDEYVEQMVIVFRAVRDVLEDTGTVWLNIGDSYCSTDKWGGGGDPGKHSVTDDGDVPSWAVRRKRDAISGTKPKDLIGIPWLLAFALRADGWYLRSEIIWHKLNPMPESVTDRPTKAHEQLFLLSKQPDYYYDADAIAEEAIGSPAGNKQRVDSADRGCPRPGGVASGIPWAGAAEEEDPSDDWIGGREAPVKREPTRGEGYGAAKGANGRNTADRDGGFGSELTRNRRTVWSLAAEPFRGAHFATFPRALIEPCILAGAPAGGIVLDPFMGSGTVAQVAESLGRKFIGCELNPEFAKMYGTLREAQVGMGF